jgi:hypothetical protein
MDDVFFKWDKGRASNKPPILFNGHRHFIIDLTLFQYFSIAVQMSALVDRVKKA